MRKKDLQRESSWINAGGPQCSLFLRRTGPRRSQMEKIVAFGFIGAIIGLCFGIAFAFGLAAFTSILPTDHSELVRVARGLAIVMTMMGGFMLLITLVEWATAGLRRKHADIRRAAGG